MFGLNYFGLLLKEITENHRKVKKYQYNIYFCFVYTALPGHIDLIIKPCYYVMFLI